MRFGGSNFFRLESKIADEKKKAGQPKKVGHCLIPEMDEEEEDYDRLIT